MSDPVRKNQPSYSELLHEIELLRSENVRLNESNRKAYDYIRSKVNQLLEIIGTKTLKPEELDDASMVEFDPIGIVSCSFDMVLKNLRETNRNLHFAHDEIQTIFDSVGAALLVLSPQREVLAYNQKTRDLLIREDRDITGQFCHEAVCGNRPKSSECVFEKVMATGREQHIQDWSLDGRDFNVIGRPMYDENNEISHVILSYTDVTARKNAEAALVESLTEVQQANSQIQGILQSVSDCLLISDSDDKIVLLNRKAEALLGFSMMDRAKPPGIEMIPSEALRELLSSAKSSEPFIKQDLAFTDVRGVENIYQARVTVIRSPCGEYRGCVTFLHDVTEQRALERSKSEFVSTAAHELRTPLATIIGYTDLLLHEDVDTQDNLREYLQMILQKAERLADIVNDLLDISRIESGDALQLAPEPYLLSRLCREVLDSYATLGDRHEIGIELSGSEPVMVNVDRYAFSQVLENIISNAVKYSPDGGRICLSACEEGGVCHISISDTGIGMSSEQLEKIFDKFYRADATNTAIAGTGLGMTIVKHLVEAQQGTVLVESQPGRGTTVRLSFPVAEASSVTCQ